MRAAWQEIALTAVGEDGCDGILVDKSGRGHPVGLDAVNASNFDAGHVEQLASLNLKLAQHGKVSVNANQPDLALGTCGMLMEDFAASETCILKFQEAVKRGLVVEARAGKGVDCTDVGINAMAAFLIGAGKYSYFHCAPSFQSDSAWPNVHDPWLDWLPPYDRPLGVPGDAVNRMEGKNVVWEREFKHSLRMTKVKFYPSRGHGVITWAGGVVDKGPIPLQNKKPEGCIYQNFDISVWTSPDR